MPRPIIGPQPTDDTPIDGLVRAKPASPAALEARLRVRRSGEYLTAIGRLDAGSHAIDRSLTQAVLDAIAQEFAELSLEQRPTGLVAKCDLGDSFEVHSLDIVLATAVHVRAREPLPDGLERARTLALHPQYLFVEVYPQSMRAVRADGSVNVVTTP